MIFADALLARRLEAAEAAVARACSGAGSEILEIAGGCAVFAGAESPLTQAVGLGLNGPVGPARIAELEAFFHSRGARAAIDLCPHADPAFVEALSDRGYRIAEFNNVLVRLLQGLEIGLTPRVRRALPGERDVWSHTVGHAFFEQPELTGAEMDVGRAVFDMPGALCYLAATESGRHAGGAALVIHNGLAVLFSDGAIPAHRRLGLHRELIQARLYEALAQGCVMAAASTQPGSPSQRNYERMGFQVAYTKVTIVR
jgi:GNAT superfamily N-acetyltransferase